MSNKLEEVFQLSVYSRNGIKGVKSISQQIKEYK